MRILLSAVLLAACSRADLADPVPEGAVIAGVIEDSAALIGGSAGESQIGDLLLKNDRARFVVQAARDDGHYYESVGGGVIDADIVRTSGPDHDAVDEWTGMFGLGRISRATAVEVIEDGRRGDEAIVRVTGEEIPLSLFTGTAENNNIVPDLGMSVVTDYILRPDTALLEVRTTLVVGDEPADIAPGDVLQGGLEALTPWDPGVGLDAPGEDTRRFTAYVHRHNEAAWAIVPEPGQTSIIGPDGRLLASVGDLIVSFQEPTELPAGSEFTYIRYYAVAKDLASITDEVQELDGTETRSESGVVTDGQDPVAGARVHILVDGAPFSMAVTDSNGAWKAQVPAAGQISVRASGQLDGLTPDISESTSAWGPQADDSRNDLIDVTAISTKAADGYGLATAEAPQTLTQPAQLTVRCPDGLPFEVQIKGSSDERDPRLQVPPISNTVAIAWAIDGEVTFNVPPGQVELLAHRGLTYERDVQTLELTPGGAQEVTVTLPKAFDSDGWLVSDPHSHASPSIDGKVSMAERLVGTSARGIQLHVGTDHDHVADYRGLLDRLGLGEHLRSIVAIEVSPTLRGHMNVWPVTPRDLPNGGAVRWWTDFPEDTEALVARFAEMGGGERVFVQTNHPFDTGLLDFARWQVGSIGRPDKWTKNLDLYEINNAGDIEEPRQGFLDLTSRGYAVLPVAVSDSHEATSGGLGLNVTFLGTGGTLAQADDGVIRDTLAAGRTIASRGLFLDMSVPPGSTLTEGTDLQVSALGASWATASRIRLYRDGEVVEEVEGTTATFALRPDADAVYVVEAEGDAAMGGPYGSTTPWALASPVYIDIGGDGWTPAKEPLQ